MSKECYEVTDKHDSATLRMICTEPLFEITYM